MVPEKSLANGSIIKGGKYSYRVVALLRNDGQGFTYKVMAKVGSLGHEWEVPMVVREYMMVRCSMRGADGETVITPDDIAPTVTNCLNAFIHTSLERARISVGCPWLINVVETFHANNTYYYVTEFLDGPTLTEYVESHGGSLTFEQTREVMSPILDAVRALHAHHVLHTDIFPNHIRLISSPKGYIPVLFSLYATLHFSDKGLQAWSLPAMNCEEGYASPEQYGSIDHFMPQLDIYALAATIVYALSGKSLPDSRKVTEDVIRETLPRMLPETIVSALINALNPNPARRTASITDFREELREFQRRSYDEGFRTMPGAPEGDTGHDGRLKNGFVTLFVKPFVLFKEYYAKSKFFRKFAHKE